ncbi:YdcF family protein [Merismopedia glauca]|uniref:DUF218 domain-containing protein n=1 Tax=Merismopedia glauca CCAP 1448/3 TaxID=1296344 RepID=A0A2T1C4W3_9CYAN|nr:YdcF family protein [Merismopedia glauca]PSB03153.1 hypothetical protein C7B64_09735 [Merismopedia glauca CCAP 1448/3]
MVVKQHYRPQKKRVRKRSGWRTFWFGLWFLICVVFGWLASRQIANYFVTPDAIFVLGGEPEREKFAARFASQYPNIEVWVSGGSPQGYAQRIFAKEGISADRLHLDYRAEDTVTNFTTLVSEFQNRGIRSIYLITSEDHMLRARTIGEIVLGTKGILIEPVTIPTERSPEPVNKTFRDAARAFLWITLGYSPSKLPPK